MGQQRRAGRRLGQPRQPLGLDGGEELRRHRPSPGQLTAEDQAMLAISREFFATVGSLIAAHQSKGRDRRGDASRRGGQPVPVRPGAVEMKATRTGWVRFCSVALQVVDDCKTLLSPVPAALLAARARATRWGGGLRADAGDRGGNGPRRRGNLSRARRRPHRRYDDVVDYCEENGIVFVPYYPLKGGGPPALGQIAEYHDATPSQIALAWLLHRSPVTLPIPGTLSIEAPAREPRRARDRAQRRRARRAGLAPPGAAKSPELMVGSPP